VAFADGFTRFFNFLANMGLVLRDDPPKVIDMTGRAWGEAVDGLELSIREIPQEDSRQKAVLSVVIRNSGTVAKSFIVPDWLRFYEALVVAPDGSVAPPSSYLRQLLQPEHVKERVEVALPAGAAKETDLMLGLLYDMRAVGEYKVRISGRVPDGITVTSNEVVVRVSG
jgi:hypothetical protein